jgi:hypothetical protein
MECHEYIRLRQHYEASLRRWGQVLLSPGNERVSVTARPPPSSSKSICRAKCSRSVRLMKLLEEPFLLFQCDSDSGVTDNELQTSAVVRNRFHRYIYADFSVLGEFNCIPNRIDQDLAKTDRITGQVNGHIRRDVHGDFQSLLVGKECEVPQYIANYTGQMEGRRIQSGFTCLHLRVIEDFIDDGQQAIC